MPLPSPSVRLLGIVLVSTVAVAACSSSNDTTAPNASLAGNYTLASFEQVGVIPALTPPAATGSLVLTTTRYKVTININIPGSPLAIVDSGTYTATATTLTQTSDGAFGQSTGTYTLNSTTLVTDLTSIGGRIKSTWQR